MLNLSGAEVVPAGGGEGTSVKLGVSELDLRAGFA